MTTIQLNNKDKTSFNFKYDNDLPAKPIIECTYEFGYSKEQNIYGLCIYLDNYSINILNDISINGYYLLQNNTLCLLVNESYIILENLDDLLIKELKNKNLYFYFFDKNREFLIGRKID